MNVINTTFIIDHKKKYASINTTQINTTKFRSRINTINTRASPTTLHNTTLLQSIKQYHRPATQTQSFAHFTMYQYRIHATILMIPCVTNILSMRNK